MTELTDDEKAKMMAVRLKARAFAWVVKQSNEPQRIPPDLYESLADEEIGLFKFYLDVYKLRQRPGDGLWIPK